MNYKLTLRNRSNKRRSSEAKADLKNFTRYIISELGLSKHIKEVKLAYTKDFYGYYPKGKPLGGFKKLYNNKTVSINFTRNWDADKKGRYIAIIQELTHVKHMIEGRLSISRNSKNLEWKGKPQSKWKDFRYSQYETIEGDKESHEYLCKHCPWYRGVKKNIDKYLDLGLAGVF